VLGFQVILAHKKMEGLQRWRQEIREEQEYMDPSAPFFETIEVSYSLLPVEVSYSLFFRVAPDTVTS